MTEQEALRKMVAPGTRRPGKYLQGVIQIHVTRSCNLSCFACTQGSNLAGKVTFITPEQFEQAVLSVKDFFGVVGVFGGNPCMHPQFETLCEILRKHIPLDRRGLWANHPMGKAAVCRATFSARHSNINVHLDQAAYDEWKAGWPECNPVGLHQDSRHSPPFVAMKDVLRTVCSDCQGNTGWYNGADGNTYLSAEPGVADEQDWQRCPTCEGVGQVYDEGRAWELISTCPINQHWSALVGVFRGELRAWFCEIAAAQSFLHQDEPDYPDTGTPLWPMGEEFGPWWKQPMATFRDQVRKHCHDCGIPIQSRGELSQAGVSGVEQVSKTHAGVYRPKRKFRDVQLVEDVVQLGTERLENVTKYLANGAAR